MSMQGKRSREMSRRQFLRSLTAAPLLGYSATPAAALFSAIVSGQSQKAWASQLGLKPRNLILMHDNGAPAAYMFDQFFTPYSSSGFNRNPALGTQFRLENGRYVGADYITHAMRGVQVGTMWTHSLPAPGGGYRPMAGLLDNLLCLQGINTRNAGHDASTLWAHLAPGAKQSSAALAGDAIAAPFAALNLGASGYRYKSVKSKSAVAPSMSGNALVNLLNPFVAVGSAAFQSKRSAVREAYRNLFPMFDELARAGHIGAESLILNRNSAMDLVETNFTELQTQWTALQGKYQDLITRAIYDPANPLAGFNDFPIGEGASAPVLPYQVRNSDSDIISLHTQADMRDVVGASSTVGGLASSFAVTEYVLRNRLCGSIAFSIGSIGGLLRPGGGTFGMVNDQHNVGSMSSMYFNCLRYRAIAACLLELINQLRVAEMFSDTVIRWGGEFVRNPRADGSGSDHGFNGARYCFYSGAFDGPLIVGKLTSNDSRMGWGRGAAIPELGREANLVDVAILLAHLIGVEPPFTSETPVVTLTSNGLQSRIGLSSHV